MKGSALTALSYAAIVAVYAAGYAQTREASDRFLVDIPAERQYQIPLPDGTSVRAARPFVELPSIAPVPESPRASEPVRDTGFTGGAEPGGAREPVRETDSIRTAEPDSPASASSSASAAESGAARPDAPKVLAAEPGSAPGASAPPQPVPPVAAEEPAPAAPAPPAAVFVPPPVVYAPPAARPAPAPPAAPTAAPSPFAAPVSLRDGKYQGRGVCRHGSIEAQVEIVRGRIFFLTITACNVQYDCGDLMVLDDRIYENQRLTVDYVAGSTESTIAYYGAILNALAKAK